jgi:hypothetical protein
MKTRDTLCKAIKNTNVILYKIDVHLLWLLVIKETRQGDHPCAQSVYASALFFVAYYLT